MNKEYKKKWLKALRSGEYVQGKGRLCIRGEKYDKFCCLGVLCDVIARENNENWSFYENFPYSNCFRGEKHFLPNSIKTTLNISNANHMDLVHLNDDCGRSFKKIADWIEKNL